MYLDKGVTMVKDRGRKGKPPIPFPARSGGERSEPERSAGNGGPVAAAPSTWGSCPRS